MVIKPVAAGLIKSSIDLARTEVSKIGTGGTFRLLKPQIWLVPIMYACASILVVNITFFEL